MEYHPLFRFLDIYLIMQKKIIKYFVFITFDYICIVLNLSKLRVFVPHFFTS